MEGRNGRHTPERRGAPRVPVRTRVRVRVEPEGGGAPLNGWAVDLSLSGVQIACDHVLETGPTHAVSMVSHEGDELLRFTGRVRVVRAAPGGLALQFIDLHPDDLAVLRRLIEVQSRP